MSGEGGRAEVARIVSRETLDRLDVFAGLVTTWTKRINLVAPATLESLWSRHILDSLQLLDHAPGAGHWLDFGSGGGFPGAVIAIASPAHRVTLVESDQRKATFLRTALRETGSTGQVIAKRIEQIPPQGAQVVSARAVAPLPKLLDLALPHLAPDGILLAPKGKNYRTELQEALATHAATCDTLPSRTDSEAVILKMTEISRV